MYNRAFPVPYRRYFPAQPFAWPKSQGHLIRSALHFGAQFVLLPACGRARLVFVFPSAAMATIWRGPATLLPQCPLWQRGRVVVVGLPHLRLARRRPGVQYV